MPNHTTLVLFAATLAGCTPTPKDAPSSDAPPPAEPSPAISDGAIAEPEPQAATATAVRVAFGSITLRQDCPDPPQAGGPEAVAPAAPAKRAPPSDSARPGAQGEPGARPFERRTCQQSAIQLTFTNPGAEAASVEISEITVLVPSHDKSATVSFRGPARWSPDANRYAPWDEKLEPNATARTTYRITPPSFPELERALGPDAIQGLPLNVVVTVKVDGKATITASGDFVPPPDMPIPPT